MLRNHFTHPESSKHLAPGGGESGTRVSQQTTILLVEDDVGMSTMLEIVLNDAQYSVRIAANGQEALTLLETIEPRLILLDLRMPVMDGPTFLAHLHARPDLPQPTIIIMTAYRDIDSDVLALGLPTITKPMKLDELLAMIAVHVACP